MVNEGKYTIYGSYGDGIRKNHEARNMQSNFLLGEVNMVTCFSAFKAFNGVRFSMTRSYNWQLNPPEKWCLRVHHPKNLRWNLKINPKWKGKTWKNILPSLHISYTFILEVPAVSFSGGSTFPCPVGHAPPFVDEQLIACNVPELQVIKLSCKKNGCGKRCKSRTVPESVLFVVLAFYCEKNENKTFKFKLAMCVLDKYVQHILRWLN